MGKCRICFEKQATWRIGKCEHKLCKDCFCRIAIKPLPTCPFCRGEVRSVNLENFTKKQLINVCRMMHWKDWQLCVETRSNLANFCKISQILDTAVSLGILLVIPLDPNFCCENRYCRSCWRPRIGTDVWPQTREIKDFDYIHI